MARKNTNNTTNLTPDWFVPVEGVKWLDTAQVEAMLCGRKERERYLREYAHIITVYGTTGKHKFLSWQIEAAIIEDAKKFKAVI